MTMRYGGMEYKCGNEKEMDYLRFEGISRRERVRNDVIKERAITNNTERIEIRELKWFDHLIGMEQENFPHKLFK